jgi:hypothetical protein
MNLNTSQEHADAETSGVEKPLSPPVFLDGDGEASSPTWAELILREIIRRQTGKYPHPETLKQTYKSTSTRPTPRENKKSLIRETYSSLPVTITHPIDPPRRPRTFKPSGRGIFHDPPDEISVKFRVNDDTLPRHRPQSNETQQELLEQLHRAGPAEVGCLTEQQLQAIRDGTLKGIRDFHGRLISAPIVLWDTTNEEDRATWPRHWDFDNPVYYIWVEYDPVPGLM